MDTTRGRELLSTLARARQDVASHSQLLEGAQYVLEHTEAWKAVDDAQYSLEHTRPWECVKAHQADLDAAQVAEAQAYNDVREYVEVAAREAVATKGQRDWAGLRGVTLRVSQAWTYVQAEAEAWARVNAPTLFRLDGKAYEKIAPNLPGAPGRVAYTYVVGIDRDLKGGDNGSVE